MSKCWKRSAVILIVVRPRSAVQAVVHVAAQSLLFNESLFYPPIYEMEDHVGD